jgi:hypothetical protein
MFERQAGNDLEVREKDGLLAPRLEGQVKIDIVSTGCLHIRTSELVNLDVEWTLDRVRVGFVAS